MCSGLDLHHKNYMLNPIYTVSEVLFTQSVRNQWKAPFRWAEQWGSAPPNFCNFPKLANQQPRPLFTGTGQVHVGEKWAELCIPTLPFHCRITPLMSVLQLMERWCALGKELEERYQNVINLNQERNTLPTSLSAQLAFNTNKEIWMPMLHI